MLTDGTALHIPKPIMDTTAMAIDDADCSGADGSWQIAYDAALTSAEKITLTSTIMIILSFIHSGNGQESSGVKDDVWSVTYLGGVYVRTNTKTLTRFNIDPELEAGGAVPTVSGVTSSATT